MCADAGWKITLTSEDTSVGDIRERIYTIDGRWQCDPEWKCIPFRRDHFTASRRQQHPVERAPNRYVLEIYLPMGHGYIFMSLYSIGLCFFLLCCVYACVCYVANNVQKNTVPGVRSLVLCMYAPTSGVPRICSIHVFMKWSVKYTRLKRSECICATGAIIIFKRCT